MGQGASVDSSKIAVPLPEDPGVSASSPVKPQTPSEEQPIRAEIESHLQTLATAFAQDQVFREFVLHHKGECAVAYKFATQALELTAVASEHEPCVVIDEVLPYNDDVAIRAHVHPLNACHARLRVALLDAAEDRGLEINRYGLEYAPNYVPSNLDLTTALNGTLFYTTRSSQPYMPVVEFVMGGPGVCGVWPSRTLVAWILSEPPEEHDEIISIVSNHVITGFMEWVLRQLSSSPSVNFPASLLAPNQVYAAFAQYAQVYQGQWLGSYPEGSPLFHTIFKAST